VPYGLFNNNIKLNSENDLLPKPLYTTA